MSNRLFTAPLAAATLAMALATGAQAGGTAEVSFINEAQFADLGRASLDRERTLKALQLHLQALAAQLPEGQKLQVDITDIDLAGELRQWHWNEVRVMRGGIDGPRISLRYTLEAAGSPLKTGEAQLSDMAYLFSMRGLPMGDGELRYEKRLLNRWFEQTFKPR